MRDGRQCPGLVGMLACLLVGTPGCATMRHHAPQIDFRPCTDGYAETADGWRLGVRHYHPERPDPGKLPVVLCHGLGLNGTFWTITDNHLPSQLTARGYQVFVVDLRGSGSSQRTGRLGRINARLRQTPLLEIGEGRWTMDDEAFYDVPAILDYVHDQTGHDRVNWIGHSLGGMLMFAHLERTKQPERIANFVGMGSTAVLVDVPQRDMLRASFGLRMLLRLVSTGRAARPLMYIRPPALEHIDGFYYTAENVDQQTISRFYAYTLEDPGRGALRQMEAYLRHGHLVSADGRHDYYADLDRITTPTLLVAGESDLMVDLASTQATYDGLSSTDKSLMRCGLRDGHVADYGHCDLVWSRNAPAEVFPDLIDWLDHRQPGAFGSPQSSPQGPSPTPSPQQHRFQADLRPGLEAPAKGR